MAGANWMALEGIDAGSWGRVADWLMRADAGAYLLTPEGAEVHLPDGVEGARALRLWASWALAAGASDSVVADFDLAAWRAAQPVAVAS